MAFLLVAVASEEGSRHETTARVSLRAIRVHADALNNNISGDKQTRPKQDKCHSCDQQEIRLDLDAKTKWNVKKYLKVAEKIKEKAD